MTITLLAHDHSELDAGLAAAFTALAAGDIEQSFHNLDVFWARLETHNALEESQVYHWAGALLDEVEQKVLNESIQRDLDNLPLRVRKTESTRRNTKPVNPP